MEKVKAGVKTVFMVVVIYIMAVIFSLIMCDRVSNLESQEDHTIREENLVMNVK